jgi:hypothetical protein
VIAVEIAKASAINAAANLAASVAQSSPLQAVTATDATVCAFVLIQYAPATPQVTSERFCSKRLTLKLKNLLLDVAFPSLEADYETG